MKPKPVLPDLAILWNTVILAIDHKLQVCYVVVYELFSRCRAHRVVQLLMFLFCRSWMAFASFRKVRGLMLFPPFLKFMIATLCNSGLAGEQLVRKLLRLCPDLIQIFCVDHSFVFAVGLVRWVQGSCVGHHGRSVLPAGRPTVTAQNYHHRLVLSEDAPGINTERWARLATLLRHVFTRLPRRGHERIQPILPPFDPFCIVALCGPDAFMPEQFGDFLHGHALFQKVHGERVPQSMGQHVPIGHYLGFVKTRAHVEVRKILPALSCVPLPDQKKYFSFSLATAISSWATSSGIGTDTGTPVFCRAVTTR